MVMLLPHGYDGAASEHSSCRMERFLQMTDSKEASPDGDDINMQVINPTTPAQYFHALRRQMVRNFRKPLVVVAPKILLRLSEANSSWEDFKEGTHFQPIIGDRQVNAGDVKKVILCSGKHYYALRNERKTRGLNDVAIIRIESLCPFPVNEINEELSKYTNAKGEFEGDRRGERKKSLSNVLPFSVYLVAGGAPQYGGLELHQATVREYVREEDQVQRTI